VRHRIPKAVTIAAAALSVSFGAAEQPAEITYHVVNLPTPSPAGTHSRGTSISDGGVVAGYYNLQGDQAREALLWLHEMPYPLGTLGGPNSSVAWPGKNRGNLVVGISQTSTLQPRDEEWSCRIFFPGPDNTKYTCVGFVWEPERNEMRPLPTLGGENGFAASANNRRQVVGWAENLVLDPINCTPPQKLQFRAVVWNLGTNETHELPLYPGDSSSAATAINDRGQVVGSPAVTSGWPLWRHQRANPEPTQRS
jgi:uncharacterized membrane protein